MLTLEAAQGVDIDEKYLAYEGDKDPVFLGKIKGDFLLFRQRGRDLGEKMHNAFLYSQKKGNHMSVMIGTDAPDMPVEFINAAFESLSAHDIVLGPASDGGYYLIGLKEPDADLFPGVQWGGNKVMSRTIKNARKLNKSVSLLEKWYDIDTFSDLEDYYRRIRCNGKERRSE